MVEVNEVHMGKIKIAICMSTNRFFLLIGILLLTLPILSCAKSLQGPYVLDVNRLQEVKEKVRKNAPLEKKSLTVLRIAADSILHIKPRAVTEKSIIPSGGTKHDYVSMAQYWWPNPNTKDGLPYVRKDGKTNPESYKKVRDRSYLYSLSSDIELLGLVYFYTEDEVYAKKAVDLIDVWFLKEDTRMNPNLNFGQYIPGKVDGRMEGIIDTRCLVDLIDGVELLNGSVSWSTQKRRQLQQWFSEYLKWLQHSSIGRDAAIRLKNNIGTAYDMQLISYALFTQNRVLAEKVLLERVPVRMEEQFDDAGRQPQELARQNSWNYSLVNLRYWMNIAAMGEHVGIDVWGHNTFSGKSLKKVYEWMLTFAEGEKQWEGTTSNTKIDYKSFRPIAKRGALKFRQKSALQQRVMSINENNVNPMEVSLLTALDILKGDY